MIPPTHRRVLLRLCRDDHAQVLPVMALMMMMLLGMAAFALDAGRAMYTSRELQATTDAAALAAAHAVPRATTVAEITGPTGVAATFSAVSGGYNARTTLPNVSVTSALKCLSALQDQGMGCIGALPYNAVQVTQTSVLPMYFAGIIGHPRMSISTTATASTRGGSPRPSNIVVILDTTLSMNVYDDNCGATQMQCATNGFQVLLQSLSPCASYLTSCASPGPGHGQTVSPLDQVSLFTFPDLTAKSAPVDSSCTTPIPPPNGNNGYINYPPYGNISLLPYSPNPWGGVPTALPYSYPMPGANSYNPGGGNNPTYQLTAFLSDYRVSDNAASLNASSPLVKAAGGSAGCGTILPPNYTGNYGTYYAGAIYAAQAALVEQQASAPGSDSIMIILGDGDSSAPQKYDPAHYNNIYAMPPPANASGTYPSYVGECGQAILAAKAATSAGTLVYTVAYGASSTGCSTDAGAGSYPNINPCDTMADMASAPQLFYSDYLQSGSGSTCYASQPYTSLKTIFQAIAGDLSQARLIPNNTP